MGICYYILGTSMGEGGPGNLATGTAGLGNVHLPGDPGTEDGGMLTLSAVIWDKISSAKYRL